MQIFYSLFTLIILNLYAIKGRELIFNPRAISILNLNQNSNENSVFWIFSATDDYQYGYIPCRSQIKVISLVDIQLPKVIAEIPTKSAINLKVAGNYLFVTDQIEGLIIYDIKNKAAPLKVSVYPDARSTYLVLTKDISNIFVVGQGVAYCIDISDLRSPYQLSKTSIDSQVNQSVQIHEKDEFLGIANNSYGCYILDIRQRDSIKIRSKLKLNSYCMDTSFIPGGYYVYFLFAYGLAITNIDQLQKIDPQSTQQITLDYKFIYEQSNIFTQMKLTEKGDFIIMGFRSIGLQLFEIKDQKYDSVIFLQDIEGNYNIGSISLTQDEKYAFTMNGLQLLIYQSGVPNTNKDFPNIFNTIQSSFTYGFQNKQPLYIQCFRDNKHIVVAGGGDPTIIFDTQNPYQPQIISQIPSIQNQFYEVVSLTNEDLQNVMYLGQSEKGIMIYDITNTTSPSKQGVIYSTEFKYQIDSDGAFVSPDNSILVVSNGYPGISVYSIKEDKFKPIWICNYYNSFPCSFERCSIESTNQYIFCACRELGVIIFKLLGEKIDYISRVELFFTENVLLSQDETHLFTANGHLGLCLINIQDKQKPYLIKNLSLDGYVKHILLMHNGKFILASQIEKGQLAIINIEDYYNPYVFSKMDFPDEESSCSCLSPDNRSLFTIGSYGLRYIPMLSDLQIHTQLSVLTNNGKKQILEKGVKLMVGQQAQMAFVPLYQTRKIQIIEAYYYRDFEKKNLPSWMTFLKKQSIIQMKVDKEGAYNSFSTEKSGENIIILSVYKEIYPSDFVNSIINIDMAKVIVESLISHGIISIYSFLNSSYDPTIFANLDFYNSQFLKDDYKDQDEKIQKWIKQILSFSKEEYPIRFYIKSSLEFNYSSFPKKQLLETSSYQIIIYLHIQRKGTFLRKVFDGVLTSFSDDYSSVKIEGPTTKVNEIVSNNLQVANTTSNLSDIKIDGYLSDSANLDLEFEESLETFTFIKLNNPVYLNEKQDLQMQFNRNYEDGVLSVEQSFSFTFDLNTFLDKDNTTIVYKAYIVKDSDNLIEIQQGSGLWIQFNPQSLYFQMKNNLFYFNKILSGFKSSDEFMKSETIRVVGSDGFTEAYDEFQMKFNKIPFLHILYLLFKIGGPILGIFGIWRYKSTIYYLLMESRYTYSNDTAVVGEMYMKQIVLFENIYQDVQKLWKLLLQENSFQNKQILIDYEKDQKIEISGIIKAMYRIFEANQKVFQKLDPREFVYEESRLFRITKGYVCSVLLSHDKVTQKALAYLKKQGTKIYTKNDWYRRYINIIPKLEASRNHLIRKAYKQLNQSMLMNNNLNEIESGRQMKDHERVINQNSDQLDNYLKYQKIDDKALSFNNLSPFPRIETVDQQIQQDLQIQSFSKYNLQLLKEIIILIASGIKINTIFQINPSFGESLHKCSQQLDSVTAYKKNTGICKCLRKLTMQNYKSIGFNKNNPLPNWLTCEIIDGVIHIFGIPMANDEPEILIRIIDENLFTIKSFTIIIKDKDGGDLRDKKYVKLKEEEIKKLQKSEVARISSSKQRPQVSTQFKQDKFVGSFFKQENEQIDKQNIELQSLEIKKDNNDDQTMMKSLSSSFCIPNENISASQNQNQSQNEEVSPVSIINLIKIHLNQNDLLKQQIAITRLDNSNNLNRSKLIVKKLMSVILNLNQLNINQPTHFKRLFSHIRYQKSTTRIL